MTSSKQASKQHKLSNWKWRRLEKPTRVQAKVATAKAVKRDNKPRCIANKKLKACCQRKMKEERRKKSREFNFMR